MVVKSSATKYTMEDFKRFKQRVDSVSPRKV